MEIRQFSEPAPAEPGRVVDHLARPGADGGVAAGALAAPRPGAAGKPGQRRPLPRLAGLE